MGFNAGTIQCLELSVASWHKSHDKSSPKVQSTQRSSWCSARIMVASSALSITTILSWKSFIWGLAMPTCFTSHISGCDSQCSHCPSKHEMSARCVDHVYIVSVSPEPYMYVCTMCKSGSVSGHLTTALLWCRYAVQCFNIWLGVILDVHVMCRNLT